MVLLLLLASPPPLLPPLLALLPDLLTPDVVVVDDELGGSIFIEEYDVEGPLLPPTTPVKDWPLLLPLPPVTLAVPLLTFLLVHEDDDDG